MNNLSDKLFLIGIAATVFSYTTLSIWAQFGFLTIGVLAGIGSLVTMYLNGKESK